MNQVHVNESPRKMWLTPAIERIGTFAAVMQTGGSREGPDGQGGTMKMAPNMV